MKKIFLTLVLLTMGINSHSQSKYDELIIKTEIIKQSEMMLDQMLLYYAKQKPTVPNNIWGKVKNSLKYNSFTTKVKNIFEKHYTQDEVNEFIETIDKYGLKAYKPKPVVTEAMYNLGKEFGKDLGVQINSKLKDLGY